MALLGQPTPPKGCISLIGAHVCTSRDHLPPGASVVAGSPHRFELFVTSKSRTLHLCGADAGDIAAWRAYIERAAMGHSSRAVARVHEASPRSQPPRELANLVLQHEASQGLAQVSENPLRIRASSHSLGPVQESARLDRRDDVASIVTAPRRDEVQDSKPAEHDQVYIEDAAEPQEIVAPEGGRADWVNLLNPDGTSWDEVLAILDPAAGLLRCLDGPGDDATCHCTVVLSASTVLPGCASAGDGSAPGMEALSGFRVVVAKPGRDPALLVFATREEADAEAWEQSINDAAAALTPSPETDASREAGFLDPADDLLPAFEGLMFEAGRTGGRWKERILVLVPHPDRLDTAPGVTAEQCPCIAFYAPRGRRKEKGRLRGVVKVLDITQACGGLPTIVKIDPRHEFGLTLVTEERFFCFSSSKEHDPDRWMDAIATVAAAWHTATGDDETLD